MTEAEDRLHHADIVGTVALGRLGLGSSTRTSWKKADPKEHRGMVQREVRKAEKETWQDCKCPGTGESVSGKPTAETWPWFVLMDEVLGQRQCTNPPVLIASIPEDTPGPSSVVGAHGEEEPGAAAPAPPVAPAGAPA
ncbi:hypothetical protein PO909_019753 [Leuciscus waleckii]